MVNHIGTKTIETERLILRRFEYSDNDSMRANWASIDEVQKNYGEPSYKTYDEVKVLLDKYISSYDSLDYYRWAIIERKSNECIGLIAYYLVNTKNEWAEIEYCIGTNYQRMGYCTEATNAVIAFGFNEVSFNKIQICCRENNPKSKGVIEKCGLLYDGTLRDYFLFDGEFVGKMYFSILKSEFDKRR